MDSLNLCLFRKMFIRPSFPQEEPLCGYRLLGWQFYFQYLECITHLSWPEGFWNLLDSLKNEISLVCNFSLVFSKIICLWLVIFIMCLSVALFRFNLFGVFWTSWICSHLSPGLGVFSIEYLAYLNMLPVSFPFSWNFHNADVGSLIVSHKAFLHSFSLFLMCSSDWVISNITMSSRSGWFFYSCIFIFFLNFVESFNCIFQL